MGHMLAFVAGAMAVLAFAPFGIAPLAVVSLALLFPLWQRSPDGARGAWTGYAFGLGLMAFGVFWLRISIAQFGNVGWLLPIVITLLFVYRNRQSEPLTAEWAFLFKRPLAGARVKRVACPFSP